MYNRPLTVYVSIGNSDDKLTQARWASFCVDVVSAVRHGASAVHGEWYSESASQYQNAAICFEIDPKWADHLKAGLRAICAEYEQDSIAWAVAETEFLNTTP